MHILLITLLVTVATTVQAAAVTVFAAASLSDALKEIGASYQTVAKEAMVFNFAASSLLARQIEAGAPADLFFSADEATMDALARNGLIRQGTRHSLLSNTLVVIVARDPTPSIQRIEDLASDKVRTLALAEPNTVPAGIYAREYLKKKKLWSVLQPRIVPTENVRGALAAVEAGNADAAIVYKTDASIARNVKVAFEIPAGESPAISYSIALLKETKNGEAGQRFLDYLASTRARAIFRRFGFIVRN
jgi:molybdate transport system substrate-binding protein